MGLGDSRPGQGSHVYQPRLLAALVVKASVWSLGGRSPQSPE